jgi:hypothetical protein
LKFVAPDDLSGCWEFVEEGLKVIRSKGDDWWQPQDVRRHLRENKAFLFIRDEGFVVLERCVHPNSEPYINVWLMFFKPNAGMPLRDWLVEWLDKVTADAKCERWYFSSPREEWAATIAPFCEKHMVTWRRKK